ncbi:cellulose biosynthesis protein BcsG [Photobacterium sp. SDRW27]|uniref:cellulose biosynthesis protein BcsG n=1 Tax=Photobacterium obscurum TaxID=2829490 RepID=UPI002243CDED|nr:cellulose biosynthesis protein BcsG [Photobacterium obscurum]MCW8329964.1 cellulose biosynthesis protein BcsG [Photobacterium obscurum]
MTTKQLSEKAALSLGWWNIYFLLKLALKFKGVIGFSTLYNFAFFFFLLIPVSSKWLRCVRNGLSVFIALWLLHYDSYLPPLDRLTAQLSQLLQFDKLYLIELVSRFISAEALIMLGLIIIGYFFAKQIFRVTTLVLVAMVYFSFNHAAQPLTAQAKVPEVELRTPAASRQEQTVQHIPEIIDDQGLNQYRTTFFSSEAQKTSTLNSGLSLNSNFDVLLLNICSIAWDDLELTGQANHPLFDTFDILFENFNSATSYSGPAVVRLLRASCGQQEHTDLFSPPGSKQCLLFDNLAQLGFKKELLLNHNGQFDNFMAHINNNIGAVSPVVDLNTLSPYQKSFDGSSIYRDSSVLNKWLSQRSQSGGSPTVTLYNSISAHDGNRIIHNKARNRLVSYKRQQKNLLDDLYAFINQLQYSNRNLMVVFVPEHGAAMRGDKMQVQGMREIPSNAITHVPVGIKFFGPDLKMQGNTVTINQPSSYLAISDLIGNVIANDIFSGKPFKLDDLIQELDKTEVVSQNQGTTMMKLKGATYLSLDDKSWIQYNSK